MGKINNQGRAWLVWAMVLVMGGSLGCGGYQVNLSVPTDIQRIAIPDFVNATAQPGIEGELSREVREMFIQDGRLLVSEAEKSDAVIEGTVQRYDRLVLSRDANQVPQQYKLVVAVDLDFIKKKTGERLWTTRRTVLLTPTTTATQDRDYDSTNYRSLKVSTTFYVLNNVGVPPEDETVVRQRLMEEMAERVFRRVMDGF